MKLKRISFLSIQIIFLSLSFKTFGQWGYGYCQLEDKQYSVYVDSISKCGYEKVNLSEMFGEYLKEYQRLNSLFPVKALKNQLSTLVDFSATAVSAGVSVAAPYSAPISVPLIFLGGVGLKKLTYKLTDYFYRDFHHEKKTLTILSLNMLKRKGSSIFKDIESYKYDPSEEKKNYIAGKLFGDPNIRKPLETFHDLNEEQKVILTGMYVKTIIDTLSSVNLDVEKNTEDIQDNERNIAESLKKLQKTTQDVETLKMAIPHQMQTIAYTLYAYEKMTPEERIEAIDAGTLFPNLTNEQKTALKNASLEDKEAMLKEETKKALINAYHIAVGSLDSIQKIAQSLGADPELIEGLGHLTRLAQSAISIGLATSGDPALIMMAVTSVVGFFTGFLSRDDVEQKRFEAIMKEFQELKKGINAIIEGLNLSHENDRVIIKNQATMIENQYLMMENQQTILQTIFEMHKDISKKFYTLHVDLASKLGDIKEKVGHNIKVSMHEMSVGIKKCMAFLGIDKLGGQPLFYKIKSYDELKRYFTEGKKAYESCVDALKDNFNEYSFSENKELHPIFYLKYYEFKDSPDIEEKRKSYELLFNYCDNHPKRNESLPFSAFLSSPLNYDKIRYHTLLLLEMLPFEQVSDLEGNLENEDNISSKDFKYETALFKSLEKAKQLIEFALLQQELLSGRFCMDEIYSDFKSSHPETRENLYHILQKHPILATNLFTESLHKTMNEKGNDFLMYDIFLESKDSLPILKDDFNKDWHFRFPKNCEDKEENPYKCMKAVYRVSHIKLDENEMARRMKLVIDGDNLHEAHVIREVDIPIYKAQSYCHKSQVSPENQKSVIAWGEEDLNSELIFGEKYFKTYVKSKQHIPYHNPELKFKLVKNYEDCANNYDGFTSYRPIRYGKEPNTGLTVFYEKVDIIGYKKGYPSKELVLEGPECNAVENKILHEAVATMFGPFLVKKVDVWRCHDKLTIKDHPKRGFEKEGSGYPFRIGDPRRLYVNIATSNILRAKDYVYEEEREKLLSLRALIVAKQAEYEVLKSASKEERDVWFDVMRKRALSEE